jgi:hypothetical protein
MKLFHGEGERSQIIAWHMYVRKWMSVESSSPPPFIGNPRGRVVLQENPKPT